MNPRSTRWLVALALALLAYIVFIERRWLDTPAREQATAKLLPDFDPAKVTSLEILRDQQIIRVRRTNDTWVLAAPVVYPAQGDAVERFLESLGQLTRMTYITAAELLAQTNGLAHFGLEPPLASIVLQSRAGRQELRVGGPTPFGGRVYVQVVGADGLYAAEAGFTTRLPRSAEEWRDTVFVNLAGLSFNRLEVRTGARSFEALRNPTNRLWELTQPIHARADNPRLEALLRQLQAARVSQFVTDDPAADLEPLGLRPPEVELILAQGTNEVLTLQFGRSASHAPNAVHARRADRGGVVLVPKALADQLRARFSEFRDKRLLGFPPLTAERIEVRGEEGFTVQRQTNGLWRLIQPRDQPADAGLMKDFLVNLGELEVVEFVKDVVTDFSSYGLAPPNRQILLSTVATNAAGATPQLLAQLDFGSSEADKVFVRRADENSVYAVALGDAQRLPTAAWQLRDRRVWDFAASNVVSLAVKLQGREHRLTRNSAEQWTVAPGSQGIINSLALDELLSQFGQLTVQTWVGRGADKLEPFGIPQADHQLALEVVADGRTETLTVAFGALSATFRPYAVITVDGQPILCEFPLRLYGVYRETLRGVVPAFNAPVQ